MNKTESASAENEAVKSTGRKKAPTEHQPVIKLRSMTALIDSNKRTTRGQALKKALKKNLEINKNAMDKTPIVDVIESLVNRKLTYADSEQDDKIETTLTPARFGKVYPSPNNKFHTSTAPKMIYDLIQFKPENNTYVRCESIDIPTKKNKMKIKCDLKTDHFQDASHIPSIFGKVYVKKPTNDVSFLKRSFSEDDDFIKDKKKHIG